MKKFIHFPELIGSDSFTPVDARLNNESIIREANELAHRKRFVAPDISIGAIWFGSISNGRVIKTFNITKP